MWLYFFGKQPVARHLLKSRVMNGDSKRRSSFISQVGAGSNLQVLFNEELINFSTSSAVTVFHPLMACMASRVNAVSAAWRRLPSGWSQLCPRRTWQSRLQCSRWRHIDRLAFHPYDAGHCLPQFLRVSLVFSNFLMPVNAVLLLVPI